MIAEKIMDLCRVRVEFKDGKYLHSTLFPLSGTIGEQHKHHFDHDSKITKGSADLFKEGKFEGHYKENETMNIKAMTMHHFVTREPNTEITCIWPDDIDIESAIVRE